MTTQLVQKFTAAVVDARVTLVQAVCYHGSAGLCLLEQIRVGEQWVLEYVVGVASLVFGLKKI
jgi:hypothetical protein